MQKISEVFNKFSKKGAAVGRAFSPAMFKLQQSDKQTPISKHIDGFPALQFPSCVTMDD